MNAPEDLTPALARLFDRSASVESRSEQLAQLRKERPALAPRVDRALLQRDASQAEAIEQLRQLVDELRKQAERLCSAPLTEGTFVDTCILPDGLTLARILTQGSRELLLRAADDALLPQLCMGDRVVLGSEGNVVLSRAGSIAPGAGECAVVQRWLGAARLVVRHREQVAVMRAAAGLTPDSVAAGDLVRVDAPTGFALERVEPDRVLPYAASVAATNLPPEALTGCDDIRDRVLRRIGHAVAQPEVAARYGLEKQRPWILLGGAPGLGKTTLARVVAGDLQRQTGRHCRIFKVNGGEMLSSWVGETEQRIKTLVRELRESDDWSILFIDEADAIARARGTSGNAHSDRFLSTWLAELEGFEGRTPCILIAATNRVDMLDPAFRSRFATEIEMPRPRMDAARAIFSFHLPPDLPYAAPHTGATTTRSRLIEAAVAQLYLPNVAGALVATLRLRDGSARKVFCRDLVSGRLIEQMCIEARQIAFSRHVEGDEHGLCLDDMVEAVDSAHDRLRATLTPANAHHYLHDLPHDVGVVGVDRAPRLRAATRFLQEVA